MPSSHYEPNIQEYLDFVLSNSQRGDVNSVLSAIDKYASTHPFMHIGEEKGASIEELMNQKPVQVMVELGGYLGYSAIRFANQLPTTGHYYSFEISPEFAKVAGKVIEYAGLSSKVTIIIGEFKYTSKTFTEKYGVEKVDFVLIDHWKDAYLQDLKIIEKLQWLNIGTLVVADNVLYPGVPEYKAYVEAQTERYTSKMIHFKVRHASELDKVLDDALLVSEFRG
ncbi:hypothetical protein K7432_005083 [Basidiobolus ranarum]|uniref:catechol O-methyltransferase n=1 Tax=Basidiobolus ranarum TaxID=34480 RepID=A0ABR2WX75_9FUNG